MTGGAPMAVSPPWRLRRQRSVPAAVVATFAPCVGGGAGHQAAPPPPRVLRLGGAAKSARYRRRRVVGEEEEGGRFDHATPSAERPAPGGVALVRALWRRIVRGRWKVMSRSGSSSVGEQYGQDEYEQNFDEGAAAAGGEPEPEYLSRSFSARYAGGRRSAGLAPWGAPRELIQVTQ